MRKVKKIPNQLELNFPLSHIITFETQNQWDKLGKELEKDLLKKLVKK